MEPLRETGAALCWRANWRRGDGQKCHPLVSEWDSTAPQGTTAREDRWSEDTLKTKEYSVKTLLLASVVLGLAATPALAQKDKSHGKHGTVAKHMKADRWAAGDQRGHSRLSTRVDGNRNGIIDSRERGYRDRDRDGRDDRFEDRFDGRFAANNCPPGLAKKNNGCLPPGQAKRMFREGQRVPNGYNYYTDYSNIPVQYRNQYNLDRNSRYIYRNGQIYVVDPRTSLVQRIIGSLVGN